MSLTSDLTFSFETFNFVVVCHEARQVYLLGDFNDWSASATPMRETEQHIWQLSLELPRGQHRFSYLVVDERLGTGHAASFGDAYRLPGTWTAVVRTPTGADQFA